MGLDHPGSGAAEPAHRQESLDDVYIGSQIHALIGRIMPENDDARHLPIGRAHVYHLGAPFLIC